MGAWGFEPWENDRAADWLGDTLLEVAKSVNLSLSLPLDGNESEVVAACWIVSEFARCYVWPYENVDVVLNLALNHLIDLSTSPWIATWDDPKKQAAVLDGLMTTIRSRIS